MEMKKIANELLRKNKLICTTHGSILKEYDKLAASHTLDIRYLFLISLANEIKRNNILGDIAELGVYRGVFAKRIHALLPDRHFYLLDTFNSFSEEQVDYDRKKYNLRQDYGAVDRFSNTSVELALKTIGNDNWVHPIVGLFPETGEHIKDKKFAFVSLDADLYQPMKDGIEFFYPRLSPGGYIMVHDFNSPAYPGSHDAILEFAKSNNVSYIPIPDNAGSCAIQKPF